MPAPHVHACAKCNPDLRKAEARSSGDHLAAHFGDRHLFVFLDDGQVDGGYECMVGADGWVLRYTTDETGKRHLCECGEVCAERVTGSVRVEAMVPS